MSLYVYFIQNPEDGYIKIGVSGDIKRRMYDLTRLLQKDSADKVELSLLGVMEGDFDLERELHHFFGELRVEGEWFEGSPDLLRYIVHNAHCDAPSKKMSNSHTNEWRQTQLREIDLEQKKKEREVEARIELAALEGRATLLQEQITKLEERIKELTREMQDAFERGLLRGIDANRKDADTPKPD